MFIIKKIIHKDILFIIIEILFFYLYLYTLYIYLFFSSLIFVQKTMFKKQCLKFHLNSLNINYKLILLIL